MFNKNIDWKLFVHWPKFGHVCTCLNNDDIGSTQKLPNCDFSLIRFIVSSEMLWLAPEIQLPWCQGLLSLLRNMLISCRNIWCMHLHLQLLPCPCYSRPACSVNSKHSWSSITSIILFLVSGLHSRASQKCKLRHRLILHDQEYSTYAKQLWQSSQGEARVLLPFRFLIYHNFESENIRSKGHLVQFHPERGLAAWHLLAVHQVRMQKLRRVKSVVMECSTAILAERSPRKNLEAQARSSCDFDKRKMHDIPTATLTISFA